mgnify:CR=1 FL=1
MDESLFPVTLSDPTAGIDYAGLTGFGPGDMSYGATSWDGVLANGVSRFFDVAGRIALARDLPHFQKPAGQQMGAWGAASAAASPMMKPSAGSMPPVMMTKVCPVASRSGATAKTRIDWML